jgi:arginyl-tRNA--protein-N-Asp/Glu arginylyltransferase
MEPEDYKKQSDMFYSDYWFDGSEEPNYDLIRKYLKQRHEAKKAEKGMYGDWAELLSKDIERMKLNITLDPHAAMAEEDMVSVNDFITMMGG